MGVVPGLNLLQTNLGREAGRTLEAFQNPAGIRLVNGRPVETYDAVALGLSSPSSRDLLHPSLQFQNTNFQQYTFDRLNPPSAGSPVRTGGLSRFMRSGPTASSFNPLNPVGYRIRSGPATYGDFEGFSSRKEEFLNQFGPKVTIPGIGTQSGLMLSHNKGIRDFGLTTEASLTQSIRERAANKVLMDYAESNNINWAVARRQMLTGKNPALREQYDAALQAPLTGSQKAQLSNLLQEMESLSYGLAGIRLVPQQRFGTSRNLQPHTPSSKPLTITTRNNKGGYGSTHLARIAGVA